MNPANTPTRADRPLRQQAMRFAALSLLSFVANLSVSALLHEWIGLASYFAVAIAMVCVTVMNFCTLRLFVFDRTSRGWWPQFVGYVISIAGFRAAEYVAFLVLSALLFMPYLLAYAMVLAISVVGKFIFLRGVVFASRDRKTPQTEVAT